MGLESALTTIDSTQQRRVPTRDPWWFAAMNNNAGLAVAAVAVIALGVVGLSFLANRTPGPGGVASPTPPSQPTSPPLTKSFTSANHGLSISYPANWTTGPAGPGFANPASITCMIPSSASASTSPSNRRHSTATPGRPGQLPSSTIRSSIAPPIASPSPWTGRRLHLRHLGPDLGRQSGPLHRPQRLHVLAR